MPQALALDRSGDLYVMGGDAASGGTCNSASGTFVVEYPPGSSTTASRILTMPSSPCYSAAITTDGSGNLWVSLVANNGSNDPGATSDILEYAPTGSAPVQTYTLTGAAYSMVIDDGGDQYISLNTSSGGAQVDEILPGTSVPATTLVATGAVDLPLALTP
jgi:hypothetical protein